MKKTLSSPNIEYCKEILRSNNVPFRPRSVHTVRSYRDPEEPHYQPLEAGTSRPGAERVPLWRPPRAARVAFHNADTCPYMDGWRDVETMTGTPVVVTPHAVLSMRLHNRIRVDMTVDRAVRVINFKNNTVIAMNSSGSCAALLHPNGRVYQYDSRVEIMACDDNGNHKYAKMWYKGISFTSEQRALVYLVDAAGTRTTNDTFSDMVPDRSLAVFFDDSHHGPMYFDEAVMALEEAQHWVDDAGVRHWVVNNVRLSQTPDGLVRVARNGNKYQLRTSPVNGTASVTTPFVHCTASLGQTSHLFVRRGERRMHYDGASFIVRNAGHSAGFDDRNQLKVY